MKVSPVEVLDCSGHDGVRAEARTGKGMGRWMDRGMMRVSGMGTGMGAWTGIGRGRRGGAEKVKENVTEKENERENERLAAPAPAPVLVSAIEAGRELGKDRGRSGGIADVTKGMVGTKGGRVGLGIENIHINLRQPFRSTTMISERAPPAPATATATATAVFNAATVPTTSSTASSSSSIASSSSLSSSSSSSSAASSSGAMMRRGITVIKSPMKIPSHAERTLQRRNTVAGSARTRTGTPTGAVRGTGTGTGTGTGAGSSRGLCLDTGIRKIIGKDGGKKIVKCVEVVRKKSEREGLPGHICTECTAFYGALQQQGIVSEDGMEEMLQRCSRHKVSILSDTLTV